MKKLDREQIIILHEILIEEFGGLNGVRDENLLDSALKTPFQTFDGYELYPGLVRKAAGLCYGLIHNHAFQDGNKRIGTLAIMTFLDLNGEKVIATDEEWVELGLQVASGKMTLEQVARWILKHIS